MPPHLPLAAPGSMMHVPPKQQSALVVQDPSVGTQAEPHTWSNSEPGTGTQGLPQQSALDAHGVPAGGGLFVQSMFGATPQRGMPSESWWQMSTWWTLPPQHVAVALHWIASRRQIIPAAAQVLPLSQRPTGRPGSLRHMTRA